MKQRFEEFFRDTTTHYLNTEQKWAYITYLRGFKSHISGRQTGMTKLLSVLALYESYTSNKTVFYVNENLTMLYYVTHLIHEYPYLLMRNLGEELRDSINAAARRVKFCLSSSQKERGTKADLIIYDNCIPREFKTRPNQQFQIITQ